MFSKPNILVASDFSKSSDLALRAGKKLQDLTNGSLKLIHVSGIPPIKDWLMSDKMREGHFSDLAEQLKEQMKRTEVQCESDVLFGNVVDELHKEMEKYQADILVMGHDDSRFTLLGSVAQKMISSSKIPVYVVKSEKPITNVAGLLDPVSIAKSIISTSEELSYLLSTKISFVSVAPDIPAISPDFMTEDMVFTLTNEQKASIEKNVRDKISKLLDPHLKSNLDVILSKVNIQHALIEYLEENNIDLAVLTRHNRGGLDRFVIGSVGRHILEKFRGNIIVLPEGSEETT